MRRELLRMEGITYGEHGRAVLNDFSMALCQGEILGVYSSHEAVKSDLVGLVAGRIGAGSGRLYLDNEASPFEEADLLRQRKVGVVHSVRTLIDVLSVAENIFVIRKGFKAGVIDMPLLTIQTQQLIDEFGLSMAPDTLACNLSGFERCSLEVLKAIALGAHIVIFHDLSTFLSDFEIAQLLEVAMRLKGRGIGFLMVDSSPSCLAEYADRVVVVKNGRNCWAFGRGEFSDDALKICFSRNQDDSPTGESVRCEDSTAPVVLAFERVCSGVLDDFNFSLRRGEELCIFDQQGKGIEEVQALLSGARRVAGGRIVVGGQRFTARNAWEALSQKIAFVAENPADTMVFRDLTAIENLCLPSSRKAMAFWLNPVYLSSCLTEYGPHFEPEALSKYPDELSTEDRHKLIYCRWHLYKPDVVVCIKPYSSANKKLEEISALYIGELLKKGIAVLILTSSASEADVAHKKIAINQKNAPLHQKNDL